MLDPTPVLADLVRRPSVNPMGRDIAGPEYLEGRVTDHLVQRFTAAGLPWARQAVAPGRDNVVARLEATVRDAPLLLWDAHQDTVPVDGMTIEPFTPLVRDGRMYGRGTCDVKGGMAAMLLALETLQASAQPRRATVVFSATVNEEFGFSGARALARLWGEPAQAPADAPAHRLFGQRPVVAIVAEPTELDLVVQHKGAVRWRIRVRGRACHSAFPEQGVNAIYPAGRVILAIEELAAELLRRHADHPCGPPTLNLGTIHGGAGVNLVPDLTVLEVERRVLPGESPADARAEVMARIAAACGAAADAVAHDPPFLESTGLADAAGDPAAAPWLESLAAAARAGGHAARRTAARYGTNASVFAEAGVPSVVFGPGCIAQAHTADEWIELAQVSAAAEALVAAVTGG